LTLLVLGATVTNAAEHNTLLGFLEEHRGAYAGKANFRTVRVVFYKDGRAWRTFPSNCQTQKCLQSIAPEYKPTVVWTIAFDGRKLGQVTGRAPDQFGFYSQAGLQEITSKSSIPTVGDKSIEFTDDRQYRPLVANSHAYFKDPETWKPSRLSTNVVSLLRQQFRQKLPKLCKQSTLDESKLEPFEYGNDDITLAKAYTSKRGWSLARLHLAGAIDCNDLEAGFEINDPWFVVDPRMSVQYLDEALSLVDAGDYDDDGKSELVFAINGDNRGGYKLFYDDFKRSAVFEFGYH